MKRIFTFLLAACIVLSMAACAGPKDDPVGNTTTATVSTAAPTTASTAATAATTVMPTDAPTQATGSTEAAVTTEPTEAAEATEPTAAPVTQPTEETKQLGSTPTRKPITIVSSATVATAAPTARPTAAATSAPTTAPATEPKPTATTSAPTVPTAPAPTVGTVAPGSLAGVTIAVYGLGHADTSAAYDEENAYQQMMRIAADEWAALNGVTILYRGVYDQNTVLADLSSNIITCDLFIQSGKLGLAPEIGLADAFTEAEYNTLSALVGDSRYLDVLDRKGEAYGLALPWGGNMMVYFNQTMFAKYDVKSPLEYYNEGNWTWENFAKCMAEITRDLNGDGTTDIYGLPGDSWSYLVNPVNRVAATGKLQSVLDDPWIQDFIAMKYDAFRVAGSSRLGENNLETNETSPLYAMQISACQTYDPQSVFKLTAAGDSLIAVPLPRWEGENGQTREWTNVNQMTAHITPNSRNREAAFDLLCYLTKCGMKYMADCSLGAVSCDYTGIQGATDAAKQWKADFAADLQQRKAVLEKQSGYDAAYIPRLRQTLAQTDGWYVSILNGYTYYELLNRVEIYEKPPAESVPLIRSDYLAALETYNAIYYTK